MNNDMEERLIRVGITQGDHNGIGIEVILKTFAEPEMLELCTPIIYGSPKALSYHRKMLDIDMPYTIINDAAEARDGQVNVVVTEEGEVKMDIGTATPESGVSALKALDMALADWQAGDFDALVTAPVSKGVIGAINSDFLGHTEYIEKHVGDGKKALMILMNESLRVALVTTHTAIAEVSAAITKEAIVSKARAFHESLRRDLRIVAPRLAVLSLNPHAGDGGLVGKEEQEVIIPAINTLIEAGIQAYGPYPADGFFGSGAYKSFDGVLAMYHDQGLAPFKTIAADEGVNFTAGLGIVRTSPDHGTAYDIAGRGEASEHSFRQAVFAAIDIFRNRQAYDEPLANPLPKLYHDRRDDGERTRFSIPKKRSE